MTTEELIGKVLTSRSDGRQWLVVRIDEDPHTPFPWVVPVLGGEKENMLRLSADEIEAQYVIGGRVASQPGVQTFRIVACAAPSPQYCDVGGRCRFMSKAQPVQCRIFEVALAVEASGHTRRCEQCLAAGEWYQSPGKVQA